MRVLVTGMSGTGKSAVVHELRRRGFTAYDADDDGFTAPAEDGTWHWLTDAVADVLAGADSQLLFFAGCSDEQSEFGWDVIVLLTAAEDLIVQRVTTRTSNSYGKQPAELARVLGDRRTIEPVLRRAADLVVDTANPLERVVEEIVDVVTARPHTGE